MLPAEPDVAVARVAACGFEDVRAKFENELQQEVIEVRNIRSASTRQLRCAATVSLETHHYVFFPGPVDQAYQALYWRMSRERDIAQARAWLDERGLLSRLPNYDPERSDETAFADALESLCGPRAAGTLKPMGGMATFTDEALGTFAKGSFTEGRLDEETMWCLVNAAAASGYGVGFIGNAPK